MNILVTGGAGVDRLAHLPRRIPTDGHAVSVIDDFNDYYDPAIKRANVAAFAVCRARGRGTYGTARRLRNCLLRANSKR